MSGLAILQQQGSVAVVPAVVSRPQQSIQAEDELETRAVGEGMQLVHGEL